MKLLLTSAGFANPTIIQALKSLVNRPFEKFSLAYVPTAANVEEGDKSWLIDDLTCIKSLSFASVDIVDISAVSKDIWEPRLNKADILMVGGGNTFHLMYWIDRSGLKDLLPDFLESKIYVGVSAGSCVMGPTIYNSVQNLFDEKNVYDQKKGLGIVSFQFIPHLNSPFFPKINKASLQKAAPNITEPIYALDDQSAIKVVDGKIEVVSEGKYLLFNQKI